MNANHVKRNLPYIFMAIPAVSIFSVFFIIPLIFTTKYSFYNRTNFSPDIVFSGLKNYKQLLADGIILKGCPILYQYALAQRQIITVDAEYLNITGRLTDKKIAVRDYLISYIRSGQHRSEDFSLTVGYQTIFENSGIKWNEDRRIQPKNREFVNSMTKSKLESPDNVRREKRLSAEVIVL